MGNERPYVLGLFERFQPLKRWERDLQAPGRLPARDLRGIHQRLRSLRGDVDRLVASAETELFSRIDDLDGIILPDPCDWAERAWPWRTRLPQRGHGNFASPLTLGAGLSLFHDAAQAEVFLRQDPGRTGRTGAAFGLILEVYRFDGSFLSLVHDLPAAALSGVSLGHFFAVQLRMEQERPIPVYARLNIQHGPNCEQIVREIAMSGDQGLAEFDLAFTKIRERRVTKAWLDLILEGPAMNRIAIRDLVVLRAPRADV
ncbi:DUF6478 family protein [uncultured Roseicyclus sp.]|uniref:DUF6478 family protein n=1 Tax=uncultured Roseicyclus sp. TaxID=543072 RepID=UPI002607FB13|nr:DUF6478 family protein [uncultured Roseicyclus sp.]